MSKYNWEKGSIAIPRDQWTGFKQRLADAYNAKRQYELAQISQVHKDLQTRTNAAKLVPFKVLEELITFNRQLSVSLLQDVLSEYEKSDALTPLLLKPVKSSSNLHVAQFDKVLPAVNEKAYPVATVRTTSYSVGLGLGSITLDNKSHTVHWSVSENNHAVEACRESVMGNALFRALAALTWARGSGGVILGNDEDNQDPDNGRDGAHYITGRYGPIGDQDFIDQQRNRGFSLKEAKEMLAMRAKTPARYR